MVSFNFTLELGIVGAIVSFASALYLLSRFEIIQRWQLSILYHFTFLGSRVKRAYIALNLQSTFNAFIKAINSEVGCSILPYAVKIRWVRGIEDLLTLEEGDIIMKINYNGNLAENLVKMIESYIYRSLIPYLRPYIDRKIFQSTGLIMAQKLLTEVGLDDASQRFFDKVLRYEVDKDSEVKKYYTSLQSLDKFGWFTRIFLRELANIDKRNLYGELSQDLDYEIKELTNLLVKIATKKPRVKVNPTFIGRIIKVSIVLVGCYDIILLFGINPYVDWINRCIEKGIYSIYIFAKGKPNIKVAKRIANNYRNNEKIVKVKEETYISLGRNTKQATCIVLESRDQATAIPSLKPLAKMLQKI